MKWNSKRLSWALLVAGLTVVCFLPVLQGEFLNWDDDGLFVENPYFRGLSPDHWQWMCTTFWFGHWQPLSWLSYALDYKLWGMNPCGWHATNLLLHTVNAVLVYLLCLAFLRRRQLEKKTHPALTGTPPKEGIPEDQVIYPMESNPLHGRGGRNEMTDGVGYYAASALAALFWAVHPLRVEAVAWLATRGYLLCTTFCLLTVLFYVWRGHPCLRIRAGKDVRPAMYLASLFCFALATATKGIGMMLPLVLLLVDWLARDVQGCGSNGVRWWGKRVAEKIPFFALAVLTGITAFLAKKIHGGMASVEQYGMPERIGQAVYGIWFYLLKTVSPRNLSPLYSKHPEVWQILSALTLLAAVLIFLFLFRRRLRPVIGTFGAFALLIFPMLGITQSGAQLFAERFTYLASIPFSVLLASGLIRLTVMRRTVHGALTALLVISGVQVFVFSITWSDSLTLWHYAIRMDPLNARALNLAGNALLSRHCYDRSIEFLDRAIQLSPHLYPAYQNKAMALVGLGEYEQASAVVSSGLLLENIPETDRIKMQVWRAQILECLGQTDKSVKEYSELLNNPNLDAVWRRQVLQTRARLYLQQGNLIDGRTDLEDVLSLPETAGEQRSKCARVLDELKKIPRE